MRYPYPYQFNEECGRDARGTKKNSAILDQRLFNFALSGLGIFLVFITQGGAALRLGCYVLPFQGKEKVGDINRQLKTDNRQQTIEGGVAGGE